MGGDSDRETVDEFLSEVGAANDLLSRRSLRQSAFELSPKAESVKASRELFESCDELKDVLASPAVEIKEKEKVIDRLFPEDMRNFLKVMCQWGHMDNIMDIFDAYDDEVLKSKIYLKLSFTASARLKRHRRIK